MSNLTQFLRIKKRREKRDKERLKIEALKKSYEERERRKQKMTNDDDFILSKERQRAIYGETRTPKTKFIEVKRIPPKLAPKTKTFRERIADFQANRTKRIEARAVALEKRVSAKEKLNAIQAREVKARRKLEHQKRLLREERSKGRKTSSFGFGLSNSLGSSKKGKKGKKKQPQRMMNFPM